jgi:hypothetical protein
MKNITVGQLVELLKSANQDAEVVLEGCDCTGDCVGLSTKAEAYEGQVILRRADGCFDLDELKIKVPK